MLLRGAIKWWFLITVTFIMNTSGSRAEHSNMHKLSYYAILVHTTIDHGRLLMTQL